MTVATDAGATRTVDEVCVADVMTSGVVTCAHETSLTDVARMMARHRVHAIVVLGGRDGERFA